MRDDDGQRRSIGRGALAAVALIAIVLVCTIGYFVGSRAVPQNNAYASGNAALSVGLAEDNGAIPVYAGPPPGAQPTDQPPAPRPLLSAEPTPSTASDPMAGSVATDEASVDAGSNRDTIADDADGQGREEISDAIQSATQDALDRGGSVRWHKDGLSGFAIAGQAITDGARTCRNAYSTTVRDSGDTRTPAVRWCRTGDDGAWAAQ